jgi:ABC-type glycerol-3-phosphate transport system substrate-binding protein
MKVRWIVLVLSVLSVLTACGANPLAPAPAAPVASGTATVEIVSLNHPPVRPVLDQVDALLKPYGAKVKVTRYDFDTPEGAAFAQKMGLTGHDPLAIFVNGSQSFNLDGRTVTFNSFPQGGGTGMVPDGAWTVADLEAVLKKVTGP